MRILIVSHTYIVDLNCEKLRILTTLEPGIEVTIVVPRWWKPGGVQNRAIETRFWQKGNLRVMPVSNLSQNHQGLLVFGLDLIPLLRQFRPDIIQVEQGAKALSYTQLITLNWLLGLNAKNLFFTWWNLPYCLKFPVSWLEAFHLQSTDAIVVGNQDGAAVLRQRGYRGFMQVLPQLGVDEQRFCPQPQPELKAQLKIQPHEFVVGFVGRFVPEKGLLTLLAALKQIRQPWKWLLVGRGALKQTLVEQAKAAGVSDRLIWVESVSHDRVPCYLNLMNVLVLPSETTDQFRTLTATGWKEQFGHVLIEAMACRVPVVGSDSGEIPQVIGDAGLVFPQGDAVALRNCLEQLMQPDRAIDLAERGYRRAIERYTNQALAQQQLAFYKRILSL